MLLQAMPLKIDLDSMSSFFTRRSKKLWPLKCSSDFSGTWSWGFNHLKAVASHRSCSRCIPSFKRQGEAEAPPRGRSRWCSRWRSSLGRTSPERHNPQIKMIKHDKTRTSHQPFNRWGLDGHWVLHFGLLVDVHHLAPGLVPGWDSLRLSSLSCVVLCLFSTVTVVQAFQGTSRTQGEGSSPRNPSWVRSRGPSPS